MDKQEFVEIVEAADLVSLKVACGVLADGMFGLDFDYGPTPLYWGSIGQENLLRILVNGKSRRATVARFRESGSDFLESLVVSAVVNRSDNDVFYLVGDDFISDNAFSGRRFVVLAGEAMDAVGLGDDGICLAVGIGDDKRLDFMLIKDTGDLFLYAHLQSFVLPGWLLDIDKAIDLKHQGKIKRLTNARFGELLGDLARENKERAESPLTPEQQAEIDAAADEFVGVIPF